MDTSDVKFAAAKEKAYATYTAKRELWCPYFKANIALNPDGFDHLQFSSSRKRTKKEQMTRFRLLPLGLDIIRASGTLQEYRKLLRPIGTPHLRDGLVAMKQVEYWSFIGIVGKRKTKVRAVLRRIGTGKITFWSVMLVTKIKESIPVDPGRNHRG
jgi:hypothetical protein